MKRFYKPIACLALLITLLGGAAFAVFPLPGHVPVLMYHFVGSRDNALVSKNFVARESLDKQMSFLKRLGYRVITMDELYEIKSGKRKPRGREIVITFDDGNETFAINGLPVLKKYEYPVMLFLVTDGVRNGTNGSMRTVIVKELLQYPWIHIGSHTRTHAVLSAISEEKMRDEIINSKTELEQIFGRPISYLAYPTGDFNETIGAVAREAGYRLAFTTSPKKLKAADIGPFAMTRIKISRSSDNPIVFWFKISGIYESFKLMLHESRKSPAKA